MAWQEWSADASRLAKSWCSAREQPGNANLAAFMNIPIRAAARRHLRWYSIIGWSLLGLLCAVFFVYTLTVSLGAVHGVEFCPQTFERRSYSFFEIPFVRQQVTGVRRESLTTTAETFLQTKKLVVPPAGNQVWHLVEGTHGPNPPRKG